MMGSSRRPLLVAVICIFSVCCRSLTFLASAPRFIPLGASSSLSKTPKLEEKMASCSVALQGKADAASDGGDGSDVNDYDEAGLVVMTVSQLKVS